MRIILIIIYISRMSQAIILLKIVCFFLVI